MKIIDAHLHFSNIQSFKDTANNLSDIDYSSKGLTKELNDSNVVLGIGMGLTEMNQGAFPDPSSLNPMILDLEGELPENLVYCLGINPERLKDNDKDKQVLRINEEVKKDRVVGLKIYPGYYPYHVNDEIYTPIYEIAKKNNLPVVIHSGDTYSERGFLKYSNPIDIDELAVKNREINFVIAHFGDPWIMETAEIILKNPNVYADLSGLIVGNENEVNRFKNERLFIDHFRRGFIYADNYFKLLFGTDWPLVQVKPYIEFIKKLIPEEFHEYVFYKNALKVFPKAKNFVRSK